MLSIDFILLLIDIFGERPSPDQLTGVCIDRACDVHPYCQNIGNQGNEVGHWVWKYLFIIFYLGLCILQQFELVCWSVSHEVTCCKWSDRINDSSKFYLNIKEPRCKLNSELCEYHPGLDKHKELLKGENLEVLNYNYPKPWIKFYVFF